jgi:DNA-binding NtrC family response regulator
MADILIIDDEASIGNLLARFMKKEGHHVVCAATLSEGLERVEADAGQSGLLNSRSFDILDWPAAKLLFGIMRKRAHHIRRNSRQCSTTSGKTDRVKRPTNRRIGL